MPNQTIQYPNIDLPAAEWFSFAPNRTIAIQGRRRVAMTNADSSGLGTVIQPGTTAEVAKVQQIEAGFTGTSGVFVHDAMLIMFPQTPNSELTISSSLMSLTLNNTLGGYPLGVPNLTQLSPAGGEVALRDQYKLISQKDVLLFSGSTSGSLFLNFDCFIENPSSGPQSIQIVAAIIYTRLDGIVE